MRLPSTHSRYKTLDERSQCREFTGESLLRFDAAEAPSQRDRQHQWVQRRLPGGEHLRVRLTSSIDDMLSYAGDPVEGVLLNAFKVFGTNTVVPRGSVLRGVITKLQKIYLPQRVELLAIRLDRLTYGNTSFRPNGSHRLSDHDARKLSQMHRQELPQWLDRDDQAVLFLMNSKHLARIYG